MVLYLVSMHMKYEENSSFANFFLILSSMLNNSVKAQLEPLISKCSPAHQMLYKSVMGSIINKTNPICHQPAMNRAVFQPLCKVDEAFGCYMTVFPYLSGKAVPRDKLCGFVVN